MPTYIWRNKLTGEVQEVTRPMAEMDIPPEFDHLLFPTKPEDWERILSVPSISVKGGASPSRYGPRNSKQKINPGSQPAA